MHVNKKAFIGVHSLHVIGHGFSEHIVVGQHTILSLAVVGLTKLPSITLPWTAAGFCYDAFDKNSMMWLIVA